MLQGIASAGVTISDPLFRENAKVDYLIITAADPAILSQTTELARYKQRKGLRTATVTVDSIAAAFPGYDVPARIRAFLQEVRRSWGITWVLLGGDFNLVPARAVSLGPDAYSSGKPRMILSDIYYTCLDGEWIPGTDSLYGTVPGKIDYGLVCRYESDGSYVCDIESSVDGLDLLPDIYLGRLPFSNASEAATMIAKTLAYQCRPPSGLGSAGMLFFGVQLHGLNHTVDDATYLWHYELRPALRSWRMTVHGLYEDSITASGHAVNASIRITPEIVSEHFSRGYNLLWFACHGFSLGIQISSLPAPPSVMWGIEDIAALRSSSYTNVIALSCSVMEMDSSTNTCVAKELLSNPHGGAVSFTGSSSLDYLYSKRRFLLGAAGLMRDYGITRIAQAFTLQLTRPTTSRYDKFIHQYWGDPEMPLWTKDIGRGDSIFTTIELVDERYRVRVSPALDSILVCLSAQGGVIQRGYSASGEVWFDVFDNSIRKLTLTATAHNRIPSIRIFDAGSIPAATVARSPRSPIQEFPAGAMTIYDARGRRVGLGSSQLRQLPSGVYLVRRAESPPRKTLR